jgi:hypothetical protein
VPSSLTDVNQAITMQEKTFEWTFHNLMMRNEFTAMALLTAGHDDDIPDKIDSFCDSKPWITKCEG